MMTSCNVLNLEQKFNLIVDQKRSSSYRKPKDNFEVSLGFVSNILKGKHEHLSDYESNQNKDNSRLLQTNLNIVYKWTFCLARKKPP